MLSSFGYVRVFKKILLKESLKRSKPNGFLVYVVIINSPRYAKISQKDTFSGSIILEMNRYSEFRSNSHNWENDRKQIELVWRCSEEINDIVNEMRVKRNR